MPGIGVGQRGGGQPVFLGSVQSAARHPPGGASGGTRPGPTAGLGVCPARVADGHVPAPAGKPGDRGWASPDVLWQPGSRSTPGDDRRRVAVPSGLGVEFLLPSQGKWSWVLSSGGDCGRTECLGDTWCFRCAVPSAAAGNSGECRVNWSRAVYSYREAMISDQGCRIGDGCCLFRLGRSVHW